MKKILFQPQATSAATEIFIGSDFLTGDLLQQLCGVHPVVIIADASVKEVYAQKLAAMLRAKLLTIVSGEEKKNLNMVQELMGEFFERKYGRDTVLIAIGGGVTSDLVGFIASIYMRGISLILIPTTLLAMVDAAIGGKNGIDMPFGKNLIGTLYHPQAILVDLHTLETLPKEEWINGFAEIVKIGLVYDPWIWQRVEEYKFEKNLTLISRAIEAKIAIVQQDLTDCSLRRILNFGHTIAHALEAACEYQIPHGLAVALGCLTEAHLSMQLGYLPLADFSRVQELYRNFPLCLPKSYSQKALLQALAFDKKQLQGQMRFVLIEGIARAACFEGVYCRSVTQAELEPSLQWLARQYG